MAGVGVGGAGGAMPRVPPIGQAGLSTWCVPLERGAACLFVLRECACGTRRAPGSGAAWGRRSLTLTRGEDGREPRCSAGETGRWSGPGS